MALPPPGGAFLQGATCDVVVPEANSWEELTPSGALPPARSRVRGAMVSRHDADGFYVFGGYSTSLSSASTAVRVVSSG